MSSRRVRISPIAVLGVGLILVLIAVAFAARGGGVDKGGTGNQRVAARDATKPEKRCTSERTYDGVKQELFRSAAQLRTSDQAAYDRLSAYSALRMERPLLRSHDKDLGTVRCSGTLFLDLPPGVAAVGGRRSLTADIDYILQPAADGSGDVVMLEGEAPITIPLATLARSGSYSDLMATRAASEPPQAAAATGPAEPAPVLRPLPPAPSAPVVAAQAPPSRPLSPPTGTAAVVGKPTAESAKAASGSAKPSFNCRYARTRGEISVCSDAGLALLDRRMANNYYRAVASANADQREALRTSRNAFLRKRDRCTSPSCVSASYQERLGEISNIMTR